MLPRLCGNYTFHAAIRSSMCNQESHGYSTALCQSSPVYAGFLMFVVIARIHSDHIDVIRLFKDSYGFLWQERFFRVLTDVLIT